MPANTDDSLLCDRLARNAVHAAMAGKTDVLMGLWYNTFIHVPIPLAIAGKKNLGPESEVWNAVLAGHRANRLDSRGAKDQRRAAPRASRAAFSMAERGALSPVQISNWRAACSRNICRPGTSVLPCSRARRSSSVSIGL